MLIIGCDFHPGFQQVAIFDNTTGEIQERRLGHRAEAEQFYRSLAGSPVRVGMEACGHYPWFERLLAELGFELWLGDAGRIRAQEVRQQKTDRRDAEHLLQLQAGRAELEKLELLPYAAERRKHLLQALDRLEQEIAALNQRVEAEVARRAAAVKLQTHPGVGPVTALAMVLTLGPAERFASGKQVGSYFGLIPSEHSSGGRQKLGRISKQGNAFLRFLLVEAGQSAVRKDAELCRFYRRLAARKHRALAKVAVARKRATRLYLMVREDWTYAQLCRAMVSVSPSHSVVEG